MPWKECDRVSSRWEFCRLATGGANMSLLCRKFGISRKTGYKWLARSREEEPDLTDRSRRPKRLRVVTPPEMEQAVLAIRDEHPAWGGRKLHARLKALGRTNVPAPSTITAILHRHGRIREEDSAQRRPVQRFERPLPNDLWQMDFKGEFRLTGGGWCYPLTVLDDHSRYSLVLEACANQRRTTVEERLTTAFRRYGLPRAMLMDNGAPWGVSHAPRKSTKLTVWLWDQDVTVLHGRPYHPQTQGKEERFHRTLKLELLQGRTFDDLGHAQRWFNPWRAMYNQERPHEAIGMQTPSDRYCVSGRDFQERVVAYEYDRSFTVRSVEREGRIRFRNNSCYLSRAFAGRKVGIRPTHVDGQWVVYYRGFQLGELRATAGGSRRSADSLAFSRSAPKCQGIEID